MLFVLELLLKDKQNSLRNCTSKSMLVGFCLIFHWDLKNCFVCLIRYVGKRYRQQKKPEAYMQDVVTQMLAGYYVTLFNQALQHCREDILQVKKCDFVSCL